MTATEFEYDGIKSSVYGLYTCSFDGANGGMSSIGNEITVNNVKTPNGKRFIKTGIIYENPLSFSFQVVKYDCNKGAQEIEGRELARIMRWLTRTDNYHYLKFEQSGWDNIFYNCYLKLQKYEVMGKIYGLEIEATCDAPWGYSEPKQHVIDLDPDTLFNLYNYSDEDGGILPDLIKIEILENCDLEIVNTFLAKRNQNDKKITKMQINNCKKNEIIQIDKHKNIQSTQIHSNGLANDFNYEFMELYSDFYNSMNTISSNAKCIVTINYREIRKGVC